MNNQKASRENRYGPPHLRVVTIHSFRRSAGKSSLVANLGVLLASQGLRVGLVDADLQEPSLHLFFNLSESQMPFTINDCLPGKGNDCLPVKGNLLQAAYDLTELLEAGPTRGKLVLIPASTDLNDIMYALRSPFDFDTLSRLLDRLIEAFQLDLVLMDTSAGLNEAALISMALANTLVVILRPDPHDYQGTAVTVEVARNLGVPRQLLVLNDTPENLDAASARHELEQTYGCQVGALIPHSDHLMTLASARLLALQAPDDPFVIQIKRLAECITRPCDS